MSDTVHTHSFWRMFRWVIFFVLIAAVVVYIPVRALTGGDGCEHIRLSDRPGVDLSLTKLWRDVAVAAQCDPSTIGLESMRLEYSETGRLARAVIGGVTETGQRLQVFLSGKKAPDSDPLQCGVTILPCDSECADCDLVYGQELFAAIDLVGPSSMIALATPALPGAIHCFSCAQSRADPLQPMAPAAVAYLWDGAGFIELPATDERRAFLAGYQYVVVDTVVQVSASSTDDVAMSSHQSSEAGVYFVIPTPTT